MDYKINEVDLDIGNIENQIRYQEQEDGAVFQSPRINIHNITHDDMLNGDGLRVVLWVAGCEHHCLECQNPCTWDPNGGIPFTEWEEAEFWEWLNKPWTQGATFSGGDPLHPRNREFIFEMMKRVKEIPGKDVWLYTGYNLRYTEAEGFYFEDSFGKTFKYPGLPYIDILIDGKFECQTRQADIKSGRTVLWRGSSNQRIIDIQRSLSEGKIVERSDQDWM